MSLVSNYESVLVAYYVLCAPKSIKCSSSSEGRGRDRMVVGLTTTCASSAYHHSSCEFEPRSWRGVLDKTLCDNFVSDL
jgi:hypothetical protein